MKKTEFMLFNNACLNILKNNKINMLDYYSNKIMQFKKRVID